MINISALLVADGAGILLMLIGILSSANRLSHRLFDEKIFTLMLFIALLGCVLEPCGFYVDGRTGPAMVFFNYLISSLLFVCSALFTLSWAIYADYKVHQDINRLKRVYPFVAIPALCIVIGLVVNLFTPIFFSISDANVYSRGPFYLLSFLLTYVYLFFGVAVVHIGKGGRNKYMVLPAAVFITPILIASIMQLCFYGLSLIWLGAAIAMVTLYIGVQNEESAVDQLSGLYSRQYLMDYLRSEFRRVGRCRIQAAVMFDVDRFKQINDTYGHKAGDTAIEVFSAFLRKNAGANGRAARYGGDEFIIVLSEAQPEDINRIIDGLRNSCEELNASGTYPFDLYFSAGSTFYQGPDDTIDSFLERMDKAMYEDKRSRFRSNPHLDRRAARTNAN